MTVTGDDDFIGYVGARWPALVRTIVLMGCPVDLAPEVVATGLGRCRRGWREATEHDDLEVVVHRAVLEAWQEQLRGSWWTRLRPRTDDDWPLPDLSDLDRLTPEVRAGLVMRRFSSLDAAQAVAVAGREAGGPLPHEPDGPALRAAGESVVVYAPPDDQALSGERPGGRRRRRLRLVVGGLGVALVLAGGTWWANRAADADEEVVLGPVEPTRARNSAEVAWYAEGVLHLANATYALPDLLQVAVLGAGAVYDDRDGNVVLLADDGTRTVLGTKEPGAPMVVSDEEGWVTWIDRDGADARLLVHDVAQGDIVGRLDLPPTAAGEDDLLTTRPVAVDDGRVYYATPDGWGAWVPGEPEPVETSPDDLYDVESRNRLVQLGTSTIRLEQAFFNTPRVVPGRGGELADDGNYALTRSPDDGTILVYDTRSGERVDVAAPNPSRVVDVVLAPALAITYITVDSEAFPQQEGSDSNPNEGQVVTCQLDDGECESSVSFVFDSDAPVLAR